MRLKTLIKKGVSVLLALSISVSLVPAALAAENPSGLEFDSSASEYAVTAAAVAIPDTVEVRVNIPSGQNRRQIIMNNYQNGSENSWGIEVNADNTLRYWERVGGKQISCKFDSGENQIDVCTGDWMLISVVRDRTNNQVLAYVDGELRGTASTGAVPFHDAETTHELYFGTDLRKNYFLNGQIGEVRMWSDERTAEEIAEYADNSVTGGEDSLAHAWNFTEEESLGPNYQFQDMVQNGITVTTEGFAAQEPDPEPVDPVTRTGLRFDAAEKEYVQVQGAVDIPDTVEAWVKLDPDVNSRQIIMNNYGQGGTTWGLEVTTSNTLRYWDQANPNINLYFDGINVCTGQWMLISVVRDKAANTVKAYINGELKGEQSVSGFGDAKLTSWLCFGSDYHSNPIYLNGEISEVRMWSDVRTAEEIETYYTKEIDGSEDGLAHAWDFSDAGEDVNSDTEFADLVSGGIPVKAVGYPTSFQEATDETTEPFTVDFSTADTTGNWTNLDGTKATNVSLVEADGNKALKLTGMAQNKPVLLTGMNEMTVPYLKNAVYEVQAKVSDTAKPVFGIAFRGSVKNDAANWLALRGSDLDGKILAQTSEDNWQDPWTDTRWTLQNNTWYDFRYTMIGKTVKVEAKTAEESDYTTIVDGSAETIWDGWLTNVGYLGFCGWGTTQDYYIRSIKVTPAKAESVQHTVKFDLMGGSCETALVDQTVSDEGKVTAPNVTPTKEGFTFNGWYKDSACTETWDFDTDTVWKDTTIYAGYTYQYVGADFQIENALSFADQADQLCSAERLSEIPRTFEATIKLPKNLEGRGGVIIGNWMDAGYYDYDLGYVGLEVYNNGQPRLYWQQERRGQPNDGVQSVVIPGVDLRQDEWVHLTMSFDEAVDMVKCYINGILVSTVDDCKFNPVIPAQALKIGGDYRGTGGQVTDNGYNSQYFKGEIANISVWSKVLSDEEVAADVAALKADANAVPTDESGLLSSWNFAGDKKDLYNDISGNRNDAANFVDWIDPGFAQGDYTMVALPDTQFLSQNYPDKYQTLTQWIADNKETYDIRAVMHMGDMVNSGTNAQWNSCKAAMDILDTKSVVWMPMRGNHDPSAGFNSAFPYEQYGTNRSWFGGSYEEGKLDYTYWNVTAGEREYLIFSLGWAPTQGVLDWAESIIQKNPDKNVILTAHAYMYWDGTQLNDEDLDYTSAYTEEGMDGSKIWEQLGSKYPNVVLAMGGHIGFPDVIERTDKNGAGEMVSSLLCDAQGIDYTYGLGMMMLLTFHENSDTVDVNWYSTSEGKLFRTRNQFSISVPHVKADEPVEKTYTVTVEGGSGSGTYAVNAPVSVTAAEQNGYTFDHWEVVSGGVTLENAFSKTTTFTMPERAVSIKAVFTKNHDSDNDSSSDSTPTYAITVDTVAGGEIALTPKRAEKGDTVTITVKADAGYELDELNVTDRNGNAVKVINKGNGKYSFTMPAGKVTVDATFVKSEQLIENPFADVKENAYYFDAVQWAVQNGITSGVSGNMFAPDAACTRAQTVTFLWRAMGSPEPTTQVNPFVDVPSDAYYCKAVLWAAEQGITSGSSATTFSPGATVSRAQTVTFLWRAAGAPAASAENSFADVAAAAYYADAAQWAADKGITNGTSASTFAPGSNCTRGQIVTFLYRYIVK